MGLIDRFTSWASARNAVIPPWLPGVDNFSPYAYLAQGYAFPLLNLSMPGGNEEELEHSFTGYARAYKTNSIIFAAMAARQMLFSEARFQYQRLEKGRPGDLFGDPSLDILEHPGPNATTGDLLSRAINDVDAAGNFYATRRRNRIVRMRPDWVTLVLGSNDPKITGDDLDAELLGVIYYPGGEYSGGGDPEFITRSALCHFALYPDPEAHFRGMSWITPIVRDIQSDSAATLHKQRFFQNAATPQMIVKRPDAPSDEMFRQWRDLINEGHQGAANAYKTLYLTAGADATVVGANLQQLEFSATQGAGETRIAAAARVPAAILGISEGLQGSSLNAGNFTAARRLFADGFARPAWRNFAGSMETLVPAPSGARLWYDARDINFLREDSKDAAEIQQIKAATIRQLVDAGFKPDSIVKAVEAENMNLLKHSGLFSVQLQEPGAEETAPVEAAPPSPNGKPKPTPVGAP